MENTQNIKDLIQKFYPYAKNTLGFEHPVRVIMRKDAENAEQSLGKTAYYDPENKLIVLYITNRHPKDVLRSFSHELVHHAQNCRGDLNDLTTGGHYAEDGKGREIEKEAYLQGNLNVRDWEDSMKFEGENQMNEHYQIAKEELRKLVAETYKEAMAERAKGKYDDGDGKDEKCDHIDCEDEDKKEKVDEVDKEDPRFGRYNSTMTKTIEDYDIKKATMAHSLKMKKLGDTLQDALNSGGAVKAMEISKQMEALNKQLEQEIEAIIRSNDADATPIQESKQKTSKEVIKEVPQQPKEQPKETNKAWYNTSLYKKLMSKWTK